MMIELRNYSIKNVAIYLRKSRGESEADLQKHRDILLEVCEKNGWQYDIYEEIATSESLELRPKALSLIADVSLGMYDAVLVVAIDRLTRAGSKDSDIVKKHLIDSDTFLIENTTIYNFEDDSSDLNYEVKSMVGRLEFKLIKKRLRSGKVQGSKQGKWCNGIPPLPYLYNKDTKLLIVDETMLITYRQIIDSVVKEKKSTNIIAYELNNAGLKTKNNNYWTSKTVRDILLDKTHLQWEDTDYGHIVIGKTKGQGHLKKKTETSLNFKRIPQENWRMFRGEHKWLKTLDEHQIIEGHLARKCKAPRKTTAKKIYPLTGLVRCTLCGHYLGFTERVDRKGLLSVKKCWYVNPLGEKCTNGSSSMNILISRINEAISEHIDKIEYESINVDSKELDKITQAIKNHNNVIKQKEVMLERERMAYAKGIYEVDEYGIIRAKIKKEMEQSHKIIKSLELEFKILKERSSTDKLDLFKQFQSVINNPLLTWEEQNELYKTIIDYIDYSSNKGNLQLNIMFK